MTEIIGNIIQLIPFLTNIGLNVKQPRSDVIEIDCSNDSFFQLSLLLVWSSQRFYCQTGTYRLGFTNFYIRHSG